MEAHGRSEVRAEDGRIFDPARTPYEISERAFPHEGSQEEQYEFLLRYAILAPSSHNTQPWKFELSEEGIAVYADYGRRLPVVDPGNRELLMGVGAAIFNLRVAAARFRFEIQVRYNQTGDSERPIAMVRLAPRPSGQPPRPLGDFLPSLTKRHTNRNPFLISRVPSQVLDRISSAADGTRIGLLASTDGTVNQKVADLVAAADEVQMSDRLIRRERAEWVRPSRRRRTDGVPRSSLGIRGVGSVLAPWASRVLDLGKLRAAADRNLCIQAPALVVVYAEDSIQHWLEVGEVLEQMLLIIVREGLQYSFFNMLIEVPDLRARLRAMFHLPAWPQLLLRIGYCLTEPAPTPRRPIEEVIVHLSPATMPY